MSKNIEQFTKELKALMIKHNVSLGIRKKGATLGIFPDFCIYSGNNLETPIKVLAEYQDHIQACDL